MALAGGVCVRVPQEAGYYFEPGGIFSPDGHCRVFDEDAAGVVFGNGVGAVVLRRLSDAVADGDAIHAVVKGWAVNNDGAAKASYAAPSLEGQADVIAARARACRRERRHDHLRRGARHRHADRRPDRDRRATKAFRASTAAQGLLRRRVGQDERRPPRPGGGRGEPDQDRARARARAKSRQASTARPLNPAIDFADSPFFVNTRAVRPGTTGDGPRTGRRERVRHRRDERPPRARGGSPSSSLPRRPRRITCSSSRRGAPPRSQTAADEPGGASHGRTRISTPPTSPTRCRPAGAPLDHRCAVVYRDVDDLVAALAADDRRRIASRWTAARTRGGIHVLGPGRAVREHGGAACTSSEPTFRAALDGAPSCWRRTSASTSARCCTRARGRRRPRRPG